jgi:membrane-bound lytic murein transglycosylase F
LLKIKANHIGWFIGIFLLLILAASMSMPKKIRQLIQPPVSALNAKLEHTDTKKTITFVTTNSSNTYYVDSNQKPAGLEYELANLFVKELGDDYKIEFIVENAFSDVLDTLLNNKATIAAADITVTESRKKNMIFTEPYLDIQQQIAYNRETKLPPRNLAGLKHERITVPAGTSFVERLQELNNTKDAQLTWDVQENTSSERLLEALANQEIDFTIADNHLLSVVQYYYPNIGMGFTIGKPEKIAWALPENADPKLVEQVNKFFKKIKADGTLANLIDRYHGNTKRLNPFDVKTFLSKSQTLLPKYVRLFKGAQDATDVDWRLLAAISYQESHWNTFNTSPTNVRGLMMLTEETSDRLDPKQSIPAGAKFFLWIKDQFPERIQEPDRTFMTLASYNIGYGHIEDARVLAQRLKLDPDRWADVKKAMMLLTESKYYANAKHGYCGCAQPLIYTESIRSYYKILEKHEPAYDSSEPFKIASAELAPI